MVFIFIVFIRRRRNKGTDLFLASNIYYQ